MLDSLLPWAKRFAAPHQPSMLLQMHAGPEEIAVIDLAEQLGMQPDRVRLYIPTLTANGLVTKRSERSPASGKRHIHLKLTPEAKKLLRAAAKKGAAFPHRLCVALMKDRDEVPRIVTNSLRACWLLLWMLSDPAEPRRMSDFAHRFAMDNAAASRLTGSLRRSGLIRKCGEGRPLSLCLTEHGQEVALILKSMGEGT